MKVSKIVSAGVILFLFVFGLCEVRSASSAPNVDERRDAARTRADAKVDAEKARAAARKQRILEKYGRVPPKHPNDSIPNLQPVVCPRAGVAGSLAESSFVSRNGSNALLIQVANNGEAGAKFNLPPGTAAGTISFDVEVGSGILETDIFLYVDAVRPEFPNNDYFKYIAPVGYPNASDPRYVELVGNRATVDLQTLQLGGAPEPLGPTIPDAFFIRLDADTNGSGSVYISNIVLNGQPIQNQLLQQLTCPPLWQ